MTEEGVKEEVKDEAKKGVWKCDICGKDDFDTYNQYRGHRGSCLKNQQRVEKAKKTLGVEGANIGIGISIDTVSKMIDARMSKVDEKLEALIAQMKKLSDDGDGSGEDKIKITEQMLEFQKELAINRQVLFLPIIFSLFNYTKAKAGKEIDFNEWANAVIIEHFSECLGIENVMFVGRQTVPNATMGTEPVGVSRAHSQVPIQSQNVKAQVQAVE